MNKTQVVSFRIKEEEAKEIERLRKLMKFKTVSQLIIHVIERFKRDILDVKT